MSDRTPKVSVLVPSYNVEKYLPQCLDSLVAQSLADIQIIGINDGSTDSTLQILEEYAARDPRIEIINKPNSGYGASMNRGLDIARGEYIGIVESDDFADSDMFKTLYSFAKNHDCDLVKSNYYEFSEEEGDVFQEPFARFRYSHVFDPRQEQDVLTVLPIIWSAIYRRSMLEDNGIRFLETPGASYQDTSFVHKAWMSARRTAILRRGFLHYRVDNSNSSVKSTAKVFAVCDEYESSVAFMNKDPELVSAFAEILNLLKLGTYKWNFNRLAGEARREFGARMAAEYAQAKEAGTLNPSYFNKTDFFKLNLMMDDLDGFLLAYEDNDI